MEIKNFYVGTGNTVVGIFSKDEQYVASVMKGIRSRFSYVERFYEKGGVAVVQMNFKYSLEDELYPYLKGLERKKDDVILAAGLFGGGYMESLTLAGDVDYFHTTPVYMLDAEERKTAREKSIKCIYRSKARYDAAWDEEDKRRQLTLPDGTVITPTREVVHVKEEDDEDDDESETAMEKFGAFTDTETYIDFCYGDEDGNGDGMWNDQWGFPNRERKFYLKSSRNDILYVPAIQTDEQAPNFLYIPFERFLCSTAHEIKIYLRSGWYYRVSDTEIRTMTFPDESEIDRMNRAWRDCENAETLYRFFPLVCPEPKEAAKAVQKRIEFSYDLQYGKQKTMKREKKNG